MSTSEGFEVTDEFEVQGDELEEQKGGSDAIEPCKDVTMVIRKAEIKETIWGGKPIVRSIKVECAIGPAGVDGEGLYAGKVFFPEFIAWIDIDGLEDKLNTEVEEGKKSPDKKFNRVWWKTEARFPFRQWGVAIGAIIYDEAAGKYSGVKINDEWLAALQGVEFGCDITKRIDTYRTPKGPDGKPDKRQAVYENELRNFRAISGD